MKKHSFLAGMLTMALIVGLGMSALAATGAMTITVDPINIQVNGQTFAPKDASGAAVPVFAYQGTTYAPLRALAEAYGLEVGYDAQANMATVGESTPAPDAAPSADYSNWSKEEEAAYQEFKGMWETSRSSSKIEEGVATSVSATYNGDMTMKELKAWMQSQGPTRMDTFAKRMMEEMYLGESQFRLHFCTDDERGQNAAFWTVLTLDTPSGKYVRTNFEFYVMQ